MLSETEYGIIKDTLRAADIIPKDDPDRATLCIFYDNTREHQDVMTVTVTEYGDNPDRHYVAYIEYRNDETVVVCENTDTGRQKVYKSSRQLLPWEQERI